MIDGKLYISKVKEFFSFLILEYDFKIDKETINGNAFYDIEYKNNKKIISISYENIEDYYMVTIFKLKDGKMGNVSNVLEVK